MGSVYNKEHKTYHLHYQTETKIVQGKTRFFEIHLKNWSLEGYLKFGVLQFINLKIGLSEIKFELD